MRLSIRSILAVLALGLFGQHLLAQGPLTPPGPPAPTFKTLQQVEPRTPITNTTAVTISASGSYYLTTNITVATGNAITISANGVTLDLNGFTISSTAPSATGTGILLAGGNADITILNGHIRGVTVSSGFAFGIFYSGSLPNNVRVAGVSVSGCSSDGIFLGNAESTVVESCTVRTVGGLGIVAASVTRCTARQCGGAAIFADIASECYGESTGGGNGISATTVNNCYGQSSSGIGVFTTTAQNCRGESVNGTGLSAETALNCKGTSSTSNGVDCVISATGCYGFTSDANGIGLRVTGIANTCGGGNAGAGTAIKAVIGVACVTYGGTNSIPPANKFLGTP